MAILNQRTIEEAAPKPLVYHQRPEDLTASVLHLGLGGFHRAHQAMLFDELIARGDDRWGVCAVGMRSDRLSKQLQAQDHLYLVRTSDATGTRWRAPASIVKTLVAAHEREAVIEQMASPQTRWITLTVTEKAYTPALAELIVAGLAKRKARGLSGLTIASCDNLPDNGHVLRSLCLSQARLPDQSPELASWVETDCRFPCSMVDRIVPAPSPEVRQAAWHDLGLDDPTALGVESFWEWVIEQALVEPSDAQALRSVGVVVSDDVAGYEQAKLWMLNGSHTVLASAGAVLGDAYIRQVMARPALRRFIHGFMTHASGPLVGRPNWQDYRDALIDRFGNPMIDHPCLQVYSDSSQKIPVRWVPVGERLLAQSEPHEQHPGLHFLAMAVAIFVRSLIPVNERGEPFSFNDPLSNALQATATQQEEDPDIAMQRLLSPTQPGLAVFGSRLGKSPVFVTLASRWLARIHAVGLASAIEEFLDESYQDC